MLRKGYLVEVTGIDGAGKTTFVQALAERLQKEYLVKTRKILAEGSAITDMIYSVLNGERSLEVTAMHLLFEAGKYEQQDYIVSDLAENDFVIMDRYRLENIAYGFAKGFDIDWMRDVQVGLLQPTITFILDIDPAISMTRTGGDLYESNPALQEKVRNFYLNYGELYQDERIVVLDANQSVEGIVDDAMDVLLALD